MRPPTADMQCMEQSRLYISKVPTGSCMVAQAHKVYYLTYAETDLGSPITLYLQVPTYI